MTLPRRISTTFPAHCPGANGFAPTGLSLTNSSGARMTDGADGSGCVISDAFAGFQSPLASDRHNRSSWSSKKETVSARVSREVHARQQSKGDDRRHHLQFPIQHRVPSQPMVRTGVSLTLIMIMLPLSCRP